MITSPEAIQCATILAVIGMAGIGGIIFAAFELFRRH